MAKILQSILVPILILVLAIGCGGEKKESTSNSTEESTESASSTQPEEKATSTASNRKGRLVYKQYCVICHGADGKLGISNATDLSASTATLEERIEQITNGKGLMTPYKDILSEDQIQSVAEYLVELRQ